MNQTFWLSAIVGSVSFIVSQIWDRWSKNHVEDMRVNKLVNDKLEKMRRRAEQKHKLKRAVNIQLERHVQKLLNKNTALKAEIEQLKIRS